MGKHALTDRKVASALKAPEGKRLMLPDGVVPGMWLRVTDKGAKSYVLVCRFPAAPKHPTPRSLGEVGAITLADARDKARGWLELVQRGIDPKTVAVEEKAAEAQRQAAMWDVVAEAFLTERMAGQAKEPEARSVLTGELDKRWHGRPIARITDAEVAAAISDIAKRAPSHARNCLGYVRTMFGWAVEVRRYGLATSPAAALSARALCGPKRKRKRFLTDAELRGCWTAAGELGPVDCALIKVLMLTGQRRLEFGEARDCEIEPRDWRDRSEADLIVPAERMKMTDPHLVPLVGPALAILKSLPKGSAGDYLFSVNDGAAPINAYSKLKDRLDVAMARPLTADVTARPGQTMAVSRTTPRKGKDREIVLRLAGRGHRPLSEGDVGRVIGIRHDDRWGWCRVLEIKAPDKAEVRILVAFATTEPSDIWLIGGPEFELHDLRRSARTRWSALPIEAIVRELLLAHAQPELQATYDLYSYREEKKRALELWAARLLSIVEPTPATVTPIEQARRARKRAAGASPSDRIARQLNEGDS
jgi:integrase